MAVTNRQRVDEALGDLRDGLTTYFHGLVSEEVWDAAVAASDRYANVNAQLDLTRLFNIFHEFRDRVRSDIGKSAVNMIHESQEIRNQFAHQQPYSTEDTLRALDTIRRVLNAVQQPGPEANVDAAYQQVLREMYQKQAQNATRKHVQSIRQLHDARLSAWRDVVTPHDDVRRGQYTSAEFAADLHLVAKGKAFSEYQNAREFFARTYLTDGLHDLLVSALLRIHGVGGDPVVELQTNFGGGKTHSMIALYHLAGELNLFDVPALEPIVPELQAAGITDKLIAQTAVIVGTQLSPNQQTVMADGTRVNTLWGNLAWQLGGAPGYALVEESDRTGTAPGASVLMELFDLAGPSLILIDEWVAFVRQLYLSRDAVPRAGSFDANLSFAQSLTEAVKSTKDVMLAATLPSSSIEAGGEGGEQALNRLKHTFGRVKTTWRAASSSEGFEIVRRRLFRDIDDPAKRDATILMYLKMYQDGEGQFPLKARAPEYRRKMEAAYPFHPETFDVLFESWGALESFQRTRGVLRLMAKVVGTLWQRNDTSPLIMPANLPLDEQTVIAEMGSHLPDTWSAVIERDIDGDHARSLTIDRSNPNFDKVSAARRVARTIFLSSAPNFRSEKAGVDDATIMLGVVQPGENTSVFGDALRALSEQATYLYSDHGRYAFKTQGNVTQLAQERKGQLQSDDVEHAIMDMLREQQSGRGAFERVHVTNNGSGDIVDVPEVALVILGPNYPHTRQRIGASDGAASPAQLAATDIVKHRGNGSRQFCNALLFLAPDRSKLALLADAVKDRIVWSGIVHEQESLNLDAQQRNQAEDRAAEAKRVASARLQETWCWLLAPWADVDEPRDVQWDIRPLKPGRDGEKLAEIASRRAQEEEALNLSFAGSRLRQEIDKLPTLRGGWAHIRVRDLAIWFGSYLYLPRLKNDGVVKRSIEQGLESTVWPMDTFRYADAWNEETERYVGLIGPEARSAVVNLHQEGVLVHPAAAQAQYAADRQRAEDLAQKEPEEVVGQGGGYPQLTDNGSKVGEPPADTSYGPDGTTGTSSEQPGPVPFVTRYLGSVAIDHQLMQSQITEIAKDLVTQLSQLHGADIKMKLDIDVTIPDGVPADAQDSVEKTAQELRFETSEFYGE